MSLRRSPLQIYVAESDDSELIVARVKGSATHEGLSEVENPEDAVGAQAYTNKLLLNLSECNHLDSTGVRWLLQLHKRCEDAKGQLVINSVPPALLRTLKMMNIQTVLNIVDDEQAARDFIRTS